MHFDILESHSTIFHYITLQYRYHLHLFELISWFSACLGSVERGESKESDYIIGGTNNSDDMDNYNQQLSEQFKHVTKKQGYQLLGQFESLMKFHGAKQIIGLCVKNQKLFIDIDESFEYCQPIQTLRLSLLSILTRGIIQDNDCHRIDTNAYQTSAIPKSTNTSGRDKLKFTGVKPIIDFGRQEISLDEAEAYEMITSGALY